MFGRRGTRVTARGVRLSSTVPDPARADDRSLSAVAAPGLPERAGQERLRTLQPGFGAERESPGCRGAPGRLSPRVANRKHTLHTTWAWHRIPFDPTRIGNMPP